MRYLMDAIGEDASLFDDMKTPYAITDLGPDSNEAFEQAVWSAKEITAKFFRHRAGTQPYAPLWETIEGWANWSRDESSWVEAQLSNHAIGPYKDASPFQKAFVQDLLSVLSSEELADAIRFMTSRNVEFGWIADQLSYWIDAADEKAPRFNGSNELWFALLPHAAGQAEKTSELSTIGSDTDLTTAALNEPLGHLLSFFVRRCPTMPAEGERPPLPLTFIAELKKLSGRARELLANRLAIQMNYFALADKDWLTELVIDPMTKDGGESDKIWEAFTKYGRVPPPQVWLQLQHYAFRRLSSPNLSPEAKRRLAEMNVVIWIWSKDNKSRFEVDTARMRTAFGLANDDVRAAVAWQFSTMFRSKADAEEGDVELETFHPWPKFGRAFFKEIWPLEPALQSAQSANDFARVPSLVGVKYFGEALTVLLPYLLPFEVWSVHSDFELDPKEQITMEILKHFPAEALILLSACISERQQHGVFELEGVLDQITAARPELQKDNRTRALRRLVLGTTRSMN
jgi:hypothetical protein